ncbi:MAG: hypothetical protein EOO63_06775 [Hymenobacter sp.]|nr:MAG: hypothetical protein EOO63_06775 [Hymenobacter sp.]
MDDNGKRQKGLEAEYYDNTDLQGTPKLRRVDAGLNFKWTFMSPAEVLRTDNYSVRWRGNISFPKTGTYNLGLEGNDGFRLYINNKLVIDNWTKQGYHAKSVRQNFVAGQQYAITIEFYEAVENGTIKLISDYDVAKK